MRYNADGSPTLPRSATPISPSDTAESDAAVATLGTMQVVAYTDRGRPEAPGSIYLNFYDATSLKTGAFNGRSVVVESGRDSAAPAISALANGNLAVAWHDALTGSVRARVYDPVLDRFTGASLTLSTTTVKGLPNVELTALSGGRFAATWSDGYGSLRLRLLDGNGALLSNDLYISSGTTGATSIAELANGDLALASNTGGTTYIQIFDVDGGAPVRLSSTIVGQGPTALALTGLDDGRLMVVWATRDGQILGSIVRADGTLDAGSFVVTSGSEALRRPDIETLADGRVVVSYEKGSGGIYATVLDPREAAVSLTGTSGADQFVGTRYGDRFTMGAGGDWVVGGAGNDVINGGAGADRMEGGIGNDTYYVSNSRDLVVELAGEGTDTVRSSIGYTLTANVEKLVLTGTALRGTGNGLDNTLTGNAGDNLLDGKGGADVLSGHFGNDGFAFTTALGAGNIDRITDFSNTAGNDDRFLLSSAIFTALAKGPLSALAFTANADGAAKDADDRIVYETDTGKLFYDANGSAPGGLVQFAVLDDKPVLTAGDFFIV
ncbi:MAG: hypothetical protein KF914_20690 [Rhizobiaceae bacterium]|nr:hypothetical protein [Rhizobiaceae bacterium]